MCVAVLMLNGGRTGMEHTIQDLIDKYFATKIQNIASSTAINYKGYIYNYILPYFKYKCVEDINVYDIEEFNDWLVNENKSEKTISNIISLLKQIMDMATVDNIIPINPCRYFARAKRNMMKEKSIISKEDIEKMIDYASGSLMEGGIGIILGIRLGLRRGEVLALRWQDLILDEKDPSIFIRHSLRRTKSINIEGRKSYYELSNTKTKKSIRKISLNKDLKDLIIKYKELYIEKCLDIKDNYFIIPSRYDKPSKFMLPSKYDYYFKRLKSQIGLSSDVTLHTLRHTFITEQINKGTPVNIVQAIVGHASVATTIDVYTHTSNENIKKYKDNL